jgi:hypothetical protein
MATADTKAPEVDTPIQTTEEAAALATEEKESEFYLEEPDYGDLLGTLAADPGDGEEPGEDAEAEPAPMEEPAVDEPPPGSDDFTNEHYGYGHAMGMSPEEVRAFGSPAKFERVLHQIGSSVGQDPARAAVQQQVDTDNPGVEQQELDNPGEFSFEDEDVYDENLVGLNDHTNQRFASLEAKFSELEGLNKRLQADVAAREFDSMCDYLPEDIFGRGRLNALGEDTAMNRVKLANEVSRSGHGYQVRGEPLPPLDMLVKRAYHSVFGDQIQDRTLRDIADRTGRQVKQTTAMPTHSESTDLSPREKAIQAAASWHRDNSTDLSSDEGFLEG